jgi:hypothetical protein
MTKERPDSIARKSFRATSTTPVDKWTVISVPRLPQYQNLARRGSISEVKRTGFCLRSVLQRTVGVMGDDRTCEHVCALRAVTSTDGMTADSYPFWL